MESGVGFDVYSEVTGECTRVLVERQGREGRTIGSFLDFVFVSQVRYG